MMLKHLRDWLFARGRYENGNDPPPHVAPTEAGPAADAEPHCLLLTRRVPESVESVPGFSETYFCTACREYFVLAWHPRSSPLVEQCDVVEKRPSAAAGKDTATATVFCPNCNSDYAMYGQIEHPEESPPQPEDARVYESLDHPFPPDVPSHPGGRIKMGNLEVEKIVLFVTGEFPDDLGVSDFACSGFNETVLSRFGGEVLVSEQGGIRLHVLRVSTIVDETAWLVPLIDSHIYQEQGARLKLSMTCGLLYLQAPLGQALFCLILASEG